MWLVTALPASVSRAAAEQAAVPDVMQVMILAVCLLHKFCMMIAVVWLHLEHDCTCIWWCKQLRQKSRQRQLLQDRLSVGVHIITDWGPSPA